MKSNNSERIISELSLKHNLPKTVIRAVVMCQYEFLRDSIRSGEFGVFETFPSVALKGFGTWKISRKKFNVSHKYYSKGWLNRKAAMDEKTKARKERQNAV
jgi:nucleoid DNA-binding protein